MLGARSSLGKSLHVGILYICISVTDLIMIREYYAHREDKLYNKIHNHKTSWVTEYFHPGRARCLKGIYHMTYCYSVCHVINNIMTKCYITLSAGTSNVIKMSVTTMLFMELNF